MPESHHPGVYIEEVPTGARTIEGASTSSTAFVGFFRKGQMMTPVRITSFEEFEREFGGLDSESQTSYAIQQFFLNGGRTAYVVRVACGTDDMDESAPDTSVQLIDGVRALDQIVAPDLFNLLVVPEAASLPSAEARTTFYSEAEKICVERRAFLLVDIPEAVDTVSAINDWMTQEGSVLGNHAAVYFPRLEIADRLSGDRPRNVAASGTIAGLYARTDETRGVWKAPAGTEAVLRGASVVTQLTDAENDPLNRQRVNVLRSFPGTGTVAWGARTLAGADDQTSEWKYVPVRRTALFIEESLYRGTQWAVFEPHDESLWAQVRLVVGAFMHNLFRQGAFQGPRRSDAYFVKCDRETTTPTDTASGIVNILVGFAPLKPAEFVVIKIQHKAIHT